MRGWQQHEDDFSTTPISAICYDGADTRGSSTPRRVSRATALTRMLANGLNERVWSIRARQPLAVAPRLEVPHDRG